MNPCPFQRLPCGITLANRFQDRRLGPYLGVAGHARLSLRHTGKIALLNRGMTISAIYTKLIDVMTMTEWNGLRADLMLSCYVRG